MRKLNGLTRHFHGRRVILAAASTLALASMAQATTLYFDTNGTTNGFGSAAGTWDENTTADWDTAPNTSATAGTNLPGKWLQAGQTQGTNDFNTAEFQAAFTANVSGTVDLGGIIYNSGGSTIGSTSAAGSYALNIGSNNVNFALSTGVTAKQIIYAPITGSGNITWSYISGGTMDMSGNMSNFTGNIFVTNGGNRAAGGTSASLNFANPLGNNNATVNVDSNVAVGTDNFETNNGITTPTTTTVNNPIMLNYGGSSGTPVTTANNFLYASNGTDSQDATVNSTTGAVTYTTDNNAPVMSVNGVPITETVTYNGGANQETIQTTMAGQEKFINFTGVISSPVSEVVGGVTTAVTTNVYIGTGTGTGGRGDVILSNHNTWNGNTTITMTGDTLKNGNGIVQLGIDNALPTGTNLIFGSGANAVAPFDLNGHNMQIGALNTGTTDVVTVNTGVSNGNIYNTSPAGIAANPVTITIAGSTTSIYKGDIGDTNLNVHPFDNMMPFIKSDSSGWAIQANKNISLQLNGPGVVALAPVSGQPSGDEYTGSTTVSGGTLVVGRTGSYTGAIGSAVLGSNYTINGGGDVNIGNGATLASLSTAAGTYAGAASGTITLNSGSQLIPGEANGTALALSTNNVGSLSVNNLNFDGGAAMTFSIASTSSYDYLFYNGSLNLDSSSPTHTINIVLPTGKNLAPGTYTLINGFNGIGGDGTNGDGTSSGFVIGAKPSGYNNYSYKLFDNAGPTGTALQLQVIAPSLQWDPSGQGLATSTGTIQEGGGEWTDGSGSDGQPATTFYDYTLSQDVPWVNGSNKQIYIGNDANQNGGTITLGSNISMLGVLTFGSIASGNNYKIVNGSNTYTLTLGGGISVLNAAATSTTPSAEIDTPIVISADQTWDVPSGQFLDIKGTVTGSFALTQADSGVIDIESSGGSVGSVNLLGGVMLLGSANSLGASTPITINGGALEYSSNATPTNSFTIGASGGSIGAAQASGGPTVTVNLPSITTANTLTIIGTGTVNLATTNTLGGLVVAGGTVPVSALTQIGGSSTPLTVSGGTLALTGISTLTNNLNTGTSSTGGGTLTDTVPLTFNVAGTGTGALGLLGTNQFTINVPASTSATTGAIIGETAGMTIHKSGTGTLTAGGYTGTTASAAGASLVVDQGKVVLGTFNGLGGASSLNITLNASTELDLAWTTGTALTIGTITVNNATIARPNNISAVNSETSITAAGGTAGAADVLTFTGNSKIQNAAIVPGNVNQIFGTTNPVVVAAGSTLTAEIDNTNGFGGNNGVDLRGPTGSTNMYDTLTMQAGSTLTQTGPGELRFGRVASQGLPIIGQGTPGSDALLQLGPDCYMEDQIAATSPVTTEFVVDGTGTAGLRIETAMDATYTDPTTGPPASASIGVTGLFGADPFAGQSGHTSGNVFTVYSPLRAKALSSTYNDGTNTFTPSGTLTLAANDAGNATGLINVAPTAACAVTLALDNTSGSSGNHIYQIDPASPLGGSFANYAGLTVKRTYASAAAVTAQLLGTTKVPALTISGGAKLDIAATALAVDPATGPAPTAAIAGYLKTAYDNGNWDGPGIGSSSVASVRGTSIGYAENDLLAVPYTIFGGQTVDNNAVLVKYTWLGDLNLDGVVDANDYAMMGDGQSGWMGGDLNYDGVVNADDFALFQLGAAEQTGTLTSAVPEPAVGAMLALAVAGLGARRRRR